MTNKEDLNDKLILVLEGIDALGVTVDKNHLEFKEFVIETREKFEVVFESIDSLGNDLTGVKHEIHEIKSDIQELREERVS